MENPYRADGESLSLTLLGHCNNTVRWVLIFSSAYEDTKAERRQITCLSHSSGTYNLLNIMKHRIYLAVER